MYIYIYIYIYAHMYMYINNENLSNLLFIIYYTYFAVLYRSLVKVSMY